MATYNGEQFIKDQISSILKQLSKEDELIITDDASKDRTESIIHSFKDHRIKFHQNITRLGYIRNFESALTMASGEIVFLSDQDDIWLPCKIQKMIKTMNDKQCSAVICNAQIIAADGECIGSSYFGIRNSGPGIWHNLYKNGYHGCCMAIKQEIIRKATPFPISTVPHDLFLGLVADAEEGVVFLDEVLVLHRRHGNNTSSATPRTIFQIGISRLKAAVALCVALLRN